LVHGCILGYNAFEGWERGEGSFPWLFTCISLDVLQKRKPTMKVKIILFDA
jgi:hypothetical protein